MNKIELADVFAEQAHSGQFRKSVEGAELVPYITHPRAVAQILADAGITDEQTIIAALLHDTLEDTDVKYPELVAEFGTVVANCVVELTNDITIPKEDKTAAQVAKAATMSMRAAFIKVADKTANLRDIIANPPDWTNERKRQYFKDAQLVVGAMAHRHIGLDAAFTEAYQHISEV